LRVGITTENCVVVFVAPLSTLRDVNEEAKDGESLVSVSGNLSGQTIVIVFL
jgi:hypothetical protein